VELLIAIVIIALTTAALLNSLTTSIQTSALHRSLATIDTLLKSYAETAKYQIELSSPPPPQFPLFQSCNASKTAPPNYVIAPPSVPGYTVVISSVQNWDPALVPPKFDSKCTQSGLQQLTLTATQNATNVNDSLSVVVIDPRYPQGS
jgi:type II secretory pathway pseudopilin PulG